MESFFNNSMATLIAYFGVVSIYLLVIPLILFYWMNNRWNVMGKLERLGVWIGISFFSRFNFIFSIFKSQIKRKW